MQPAVFVHVLGNLAVLVGGQPVELPASRKTRALLAYLALASRPQRREHLCEVFWDIPDDPRGSLRWSLSKIRSAMRTDGTDPIYASRDTVELVKSRFETDIAQVEYLARADLDSVETADLEEAAALFRGPFLADLEMPRCPGFDAWRVAHLNRMELLHVSLLQTLIDRHRSEPEAAFRYLAELQVLRPEDEEVREWASQLARVAARPASSKPVDPVGARADTTPPGGENAIGNGPMTGRESAKGHDGQDRSASAEERKPTIAVLPFSNMSSDADQDYFADGMTEDIITALSRIRWLFVIARNTTYTYKGQAVDVRQVARELGVRYVLEGSVQRAGNRIRITGQLIDGETGNHLWAERYDRELGDVFAVQDEIAENIAGALEPQVTAAEDARVQRKSNQNLDAWDLVIRAMARIREFTKSGSRDALDLLERAIEIDPSYARAYSQKAWTLCWRIHQGWEDVETALSAAIEAAEKAVHFDPDEPWAYIGWLFIATITRDGNTLISSARRAVELNPNFAMAHSWLGVAYALTGQGDKAFEWIDKARRLSPRDIFREEFDVHASFASFQIANYEDAIGFAARASMPRPDHVYPHLILAASHAHLGNLDAAGAEVSKILRLVPDYTLTLAASSSVFVVEADINRLVEGLRKAGLPE